MSFLYRDSRMANYFILWACIVKNKKGSGAMCYPLFFLPNFLIQNNRGRASVILYIKIKNSNENAMALGLHVV